MESGERPVTTVEEEYLSGWCLLSRISFWIALLMGEILSVICILWVVNGGKFFSADGVQAVLYFGGAGIAFGWYFYRYLKGLAKQQYDPSVGVKRIAGTIRVKGEKGGPQSFRIDDIPIHVPRNWERYLADGDVVEAEVYPAPYKSYLLATSDGLSISEEQRRGQTDILWHHPGRVAIYGGGIVTSLLFFSLVLINSGLTLGRDIDVPQTFGGYFDQIYEQVVLGLFVTFGPSTGWILVRHWRDVHQIHLYYEEEVGLRPKHLR